MSYLFWTMALSHISHAKIKELDQIVKILHCSIKWIYLCFFSTKGKFFRKALFFTRITINMQPLIRSLFEFAVIHIFFFFFFFFFKRNSKLQLSSEDSTYSLLLVIIYMGIWNAYMGFSLLSCLALVSSKVNAYRSMVKFKKKIL